MSPFALAALAAAVWGTAAFFEKMGVTGGDPFAGVFARSLGVVLGAAVYALCAPATLREAARMPWRTAGCFVIGGALASILGQIFFYQALRKSEIGRVAAVGGSWPAFAFILSLVFLAEPFSWKKGAGVALVMVGITLLR
jgi:transporter family protein